MAFQIASLLLGLLSKLKPIYIIAGFLSHPGTCGHRIVAAFRLEKQQGRFLLPFFTVCSYSSVYPSNYPLLSVRCDIGVCHHSESVSTLSHRLYVSLFCYDLWGKSIALSMAPPDSHLCFLSKRAVLFIYWFSGSLTVSRVRYQLLILPEPLSIRCASSEINSK